MKRPNHHRSRDIQDALNDYWKRNPKPEPMRLSDLRSLILEQSREAKEMAAPIEYEPCMNMERMK
jgi:hypothetical protein